MHSKQPPTNDILSAFGAKGQPVNLPGGQGQNYRSGNIILKPAKIDEETNWIAEFYLAVEANDFRLPKPIRAKPGGFVFKGWQAWEFIEGQHEKDRWEDIIKICLYFHQAIADHPQPAYFERREPNPWVVADKVAWDEMDIKHHPRIAPSIEKLSKCLGEVDEKSQLIHGDFGGNVLFSDGASPVVIDFSPYWRPVEFAVGVIIADAIVWEGADLSLIEAGVHLSNFDQHLARAELRRIIEIETLYQMYGWNILDQIEAHKPLIDAITELIG